MKYKVAFLLIISAICLIPLVFMVAGSVKPPLENLLIPPTLITANPTLENYQSLLKYPIGLWLLNTMIVSGGFTVLNVLFILLFAFGVVFRIGPRGRLLTLCCVAAGFLNPSLLLIPRYLLIRSMGLFNTRLGMILPFVPIVIMGAPAVLYMRTIPRYLLDAAEIDGAGPLKQFFSVIMPSVRPLAAYLGIQSVMRVYDMFLWQVLIAPAHKVKTLPVGMGIVVSGNLEERIMSFPNFSLNMASAFVTFLPMLAIFLLFRRYFKTEAFHQGVMR